MAQGNLNRFETWTARQALLLSVVCLVVGLTAGWLMHGEPKAGLPAAANLGGVAAAQNAAPAQQTPEQLKAMADAQAAPLLGKLQASPEDAGALTEVGNIYYDAQQYALAIDYYQRDLKIRPQDVSVRTDMGTAYWYVGNADKAIAEFDRALSDAPDSANALFNRGLVRLKGKHDAAGAMADWEKLLKANPNYEGRDKVEAMMTEARRQAALQAK